MGLMSTYTTRNPVDNSVQAIFQQRKVKYNIQKQLVTALFSLLILLLLGKDIGDTPVLSHDQIHSTGL